MRSFSSPPNWRALEMHRVVALNMKSFSLPPNWRAPEMHNVTTPRTLAYDVPVSEGSRGHPYRCEKPCLFSNVTSVQKCLGLTMCFVRKYSLSAHASLILVWNTDRAI